MWHPFSCYLSTVSVFCVCVCLCFCLSSWLKRMSEHILVITRSCILSDSNVEVACFQSLRQARNHCFQDVTVVFNLHRENARTACVYRGKSRFEPRVSFST